MNFEVHFSQPPNPAHLNAILHQISLEQKKFLSHQFEEGLYIVKRRATLPPGKEHYGIAVVGKYIKDFYPLWNTSMVIHKTNQLGRHCDFFNPSEWERVEKIPDTHLAQVIYRARISWWDPYDLFLDNCEHWATYVGTGKKESSQVQSFVKFGLGAAVAYFLLRD